MSTTTENPVEVRSENLRYLYPNQILRNDETLTLREVDKDSIKYQNLLVSIRTPRTDAGGRVTCDHGLLLPISVRPIVGRPGMYALNDGLHRYTAWKEAFGDSKPLPCIVLELDDEQVLFAQLQANVLNQKTSVKELCHQCIKILDRHPEWSLETLSGQLCVEPNTVRQWMSLAKLPDDIQNRIHDGSLPASIGYCLARFDGKDKPFWNSARKEWVDHWDKIKNEHNAIATWLADAASALKRIRKELKDTGEAKSAPSSEVTASTPTFRKKGDIEATMRRVEEHLSTYNDGDKKDAEEFVKSYPKAAAFLSEAKYLEGIQWVMSVDVQTREERKRVLDEKAAAKASAMEEKKAGKKAETIARATGLMGLFGKK